ncbi:hypothetical protein EJD96_15905 [Herbaspirillum seropedicae]|uniref:hypothetical protein n=1 Tax=Herbaspirillum seropedicae TaxID=964 RepID=UPI001122165D|nr:hypothetical protein [Herbaspirillum seropedicae]QDD65537.1 hypothetical protein EJD96_15905 [Herbaspirillum seropedicae]
MNLDSFARLGLHTKTLRLMASFSGSVALGLFTQGAHADPSPALDRVSLSAGGYYVNPTFNVQANTRYGSADSGDIDRNRTTLPRLRAELLLGDSHGLSFDYFRYRNDYNYSTSRSFNVGGRPAILSGTANANIEVDFASLAYKWWLGKGSDVFGIGLGAGYYRAHYDLRANGVFNGTTGSLDESDTEKTFAPLLELGWKHAFSKDLRLYAEASGVKKNWGTVTGHIYGAALGVEWYPLKNLGIGADYGITRIHIDRDGGNSQAALDVKLTGPSAYLKMRF